VESTVLRRVRTEDRGDIIGSWLVRVTLGLAVAGVVLFDAISIGSAKISLQDTAQGAAREAVDATEAGADPAAAYAAAQTYATEQNALNHVDPADLVVGEDGSVTLEVGRTAPTLVVERVRWIADWADLSETRTAAPLR
jgi:hypothetical protein